MSMLHEEPNGNLPSRSQTQRILFVCFCLFLAACGGNGCSSGCASCGTTPLPGGFPKAGTIPNAAALRVTRPGLDFVQENVGTLAEKALGTSAVGGVASFAIPPSTQSFASICSVTTPTPAQCKAEIDLGHAKLRVDAITPNRVKLDGLLPVRIRDLPVAFKLLLTFNAYVVAGDKTVAPDQKLCAPALRGSTSMPFKEFPLNVELPLVTETRAPRAGYTKVDVDKAIIDIGITQNDIEICDDTCGGNCQGLTDAIKSFAFTILIDGIKGQIRTALGTAFCTAPTPSVTPPCPLGSQLDNTSDPAKATKCLFTGTQECVPSLLGLDGRMDLSKALAAFSPGTQGALDFVLASAGDMNPAPGGAALPTWVPRAPPVPAEDNNGNGVSLSMIGGALPQPQSACVTQVENAPPRDIPVPQELLGDVVTPWPAGAPGPHVGVALAGRYLAHAFVSAYNSGLLCLSVSTEQVSQLQSGFLSLVAPSMKQLTFEQSSGAAAITTRPGAAPKLTIGGGTDLKTDPLLAITLERFAVDFYLVRLDRFVRIFTYTADVRVPVNLQTGKDPKTNPSGGILPVIGDITLTNGAVTNADLLFEEPAQIAVGAGSLLGNIVGSFATGSLAPIDVSTALASFGLGLEIPSGGIRKLTRGSDDFIGIFANLSKTAGAAHEEADTRARLVERIIDPTAMGLMTADRARFPKLRVHAEGVASRPTEQTWWIDDGTHAPWTTAQDLVVDRDTMLLQGRHVLHVSSRIVNDLASEDGSPVAIPFVIDTLPPIVDLARDGSHAVVRAHDYVSEDDTLRMRRRVGAGEWSVWAPLAGASSFDAPASAAVEIEVEDEEGNVARVSQPLRGRADASLVVAGSGCSCQLVSTRTTSTGALAALGALVTVVARRRRSREHAAAERTPRVHTRQLPGDAGELP